MASHHDVVRRVMCIKSKLSDDPPPEIEKIIRLLQKLSRLPVDVTVLQETGVGKCVNGLKKQFPELAVYVKPLIQSWKSLVQTAMQVEAEQSRSDSAREESSEDKPSESSEDKAKDRVRSKPRPHLVIPERAQVRNHSHDEGSPGSEGDDDSSAPSPERMTEEKRKLVKKRSHKRNVPPTPVPWSPEKKVFPPYIPKKARSDEDDGRSRSEDSVSHGDGECNRPTVEAASGRDKKRAPPSNSVQISKASGADSHSRVHVKNKHNSRTPNRTHQSKSADRESPSVQSSGKLKLGGSNNMLPNDAKIVRVGKDASKGHSPVHSHRKQSSKSIPLEDDPGSLFQPDVAPVRTKHSPGTGKDTKSRVGGVAKKGTREDPSKIREKKEMPKSSSSGQSRDRAKSAKHHLNDSRESTDGRVSAGKSSSVGPALASTSGKLEEKSDGGISHKVRTKPSKVLKDAKESSSSRASKSSSAAHHTTEIDEETEVTFESTGMSFEDCLFGGGAPVPKKSKVAHTNKVQRTAKHDGKSAKSGKSPGAKNNSREGDKRVPRDVPGKVKKRKSTSREVSETKAKKFQPAEDDMREASASEVEMSLPDIRPNYKPTPKLPEVKSLERKRDSPSTQWFGSKQTKTKVYSGKARKKHWDTLPSLQNICKEVIFDNIEALYDTGGVPFYLLEDVLEKCTPEQLLRIEDYNPDYMLESDHLWKKHTMRRFGGSEPGEMESWRELYLRKNDEREYKLLAITANISAAMAKKDTGRLTKMAFVDRPVKPPRNVVRQQLKHGTASSSTPAKAPKPRKALPVVHSEQTTHRVVPEREVVAPVRKRTAKVVAPMMQKSLKLMKKVNSRR